MSVFGKGVAEASVGAVQIVAAGTPWERRFDLSCIAYGPPKGNSPGAALKRLRWRLGVSARRRQRAQVEAEIAAYREQIAKEGCTPEYIARVMAERSKAR